MTTPPHPLEQAPHSFEQGANYLVSVMMQGNAANVAAAVNQLTSQFDARVAALMLDLVGKKIGKGQQAWMLAGQSWHVALQQMGLTTERLSAQVRQILREGASDNMTA